jgi:endonuclease/exonuclease/phosphatase family metal-dependent hydrolase
MNAGLLRALAAAAALLLASRDFRVLDNSYDAARGPGLSPDFYAPREETFVPSADTSRAIRVVTWNIDRGSQLPLIGDELAKNPADLYLFQEVDSNTKRAAMLDEPAELARRLNVNLSYAVEFEELSQEDERDSHGHAYTGQATLTRLPIRRSRILRFQRQSGFWKPHSWIPSSVPLLQRRLGNRIALVTDLEFARRLLVVYNLHLESRSMGQIQSEQLDEVLSDFKKNYSPNTALILAGDLNSKYLPGIFLHKLERAGFHSATGERIERTHTIAMTLDWIFVRGPIRIEDGRVRREFRGSDHYPVYAEILAQQ